jgi:hypothetical protein
VIITERLMRAGSFQLDLTGDGDHGTPESILGELRSALGWSGNPAAWTPADGHIVVTAAPVPAAAMSLSLALYAGRLTRQDGIRSFSGAGLASWLGAEGKPGTFAYSSGVAISGNLDTWLTSLTSGDRSNGLTKGTVTEPGGSYATTWRGSSTIEMLDHVCAAMGAEWRINPTGSIDAGPSLFVSPPTVLVTREAAGESVTSPTGLVGTVVAPSIATDNLTSRVIVFGASSGTTIVEELATAGSTVARRLDGAAARLDRAVDAPSEPSAGASSIATATLALYSTPRFSFDVDVRGDRARQVIAPGDQIYVYDPVAGIIDTTAPVPSRGQTAFPVTVRVQRMTWGVTDGHGVYLRRHSGSAESWFDLTPYVRFAEPGSRLEVGTSRGDGDASIASGQARF